MPETEMSELLREEKAEYWDLFDRNGKFVRKMRRGQGIVPPELYHVTVEVIATDCAGYMLTTQRDITKRRDGGYWEFPAGSALSGETAQQAALRELMEETGLKPSRITKFHEYFVPGMLRVAYFAYVPNLRTATIKLQRGETMNYRIVTVPQWIDLLASGSFSRSRMQTYSANFFHRVEATVGTTPAEPTQAAPCERSKRTIKPVRFGEE